MAASTIRKEPIVGLPLLLIQVAVSLIREGAIGLRALSLWLKTR
jgi:hypothetical protein